MIEQQLDAVHGLVRRPGRRPVDHRLVAAAHRQLRYDVQRLPRRMTSAQRYPHLAREIDGAAVTREQQPPREHLLDRAGRLGRADPAPGRLGAALATRRIDVVEQGPRPRAELVEQLGGPADVQPSRRERVYAARATPDRVGHPGQRPQPARTLPGDGEVEQPLERGRDRRLVGKKDRTHFRLSGLAQDHEGIKDE